MFSPCFWDTSFSSFLGDTLVRIPTYTSNSVNLLQEKEQFCPTVLLGPQLVEAGLIAAVALLFGRVPYGFLYLLGPITGHVLGSLCIVSLCTVSLFYVTQSNCAGSFLVSIAQELKL